MLDIEKHIKEFPILESDLHEGCPKTIPWGLVRSHEQQALKNHDRTLTELAMRGGLDIVELYRVLNDEPLPMLDRKQYRSIAEGAVLWLNAKLRTERMKSSTLCM